jgi:ferric-dicitrate binding protein FerR (iron transport regulator)
MPHTPVEDLDRITDYVSGDLSPEELAETERWIAEDDERQELVRYLRRSRETVKKAKHERVDMGRLLRVADRLKEPIGLSHPVGEPERAPQAIAKPQSTQQRKAFGWTGIPSSQNESVGLGRTSVFGGIAGLGNQTLRRIAWTLCAVVMLATLVIRWVPQDSGTTYTYKTHPGQQATFTLQDGTRVTLAPQTTLRVAHFGTLSRTVELDGQAYFEVARSVGIPFVVQSGEVSTQVLGTAFLVRRYGNTDHVHIAVAEGKVRIVSRVLAERYSSPPVVLTAGHIGDVSDSTVLIRGMDDVASETGWLRGQLVFRDVTVTSILQTLSRWYGYQFRCGDSTLTEERVTAALDARSSMAALSSLGEILDAHVTVVGDTVTLTQQPERTTTGTSRKQTYDMWIPTREAGK